MSQSQTSMFRAMDPVVVDRGRPPRLGRRGAAALIGTLLAFGLLGCTPEPTPGPTPQPTNNGSDVGYAVIEPKSVLGDRTYTVRIHSSAAPYASAITSTVDELTALTGVDLVIGEPANDDDLARIKGFLDARTFDPFAPTPDEILVVSSSTSACGTGPGLAGCSENMTGSNLVMASLITIHPPGAQDGNLDQTVRHEFGHTLGLDHYNSRFADSYQTMNRTVQPQLNGYQSGDKVGLKNRVDLGRQLSGGGRTAGFDPPVIVVAS